MISLFLFRDDNFIRFAFPMGLVFQGYFLDKIFMGSVQSQVFTINVHPFNTCCVIPFKYVVNLVQIDLFKNIFFK